MRKIVASVAAVGLALVAFGATPAHADSVTCESSGFACAGAGYSANNARWADKYYGSGYRAGLVHNCTRYAAYRLYKNGMADPGRSWGDAHKWNENAKLAGFRVDRTPAVGAIFQYDQYEGFSGKFGHVAYVEEVASTYIVISEDNFGGGTKKHQLSRTGANFKDAEFIHFRDISPTTATGPGGLRYVSGDIPLTGDWDGDGKDDVGVNRGANFYLGSATGTSTLITYGYGASRGDVPLVGDWDGDGKDNIGVARGANFYLRSATGGSTLIAYGLAGDVPVAGDWDGDGRDEVGVGRGGNFFLRSAEGDSTLVTYGYGISKGDVPLVGDWDGDGKDQVGVNRGANFFLRSPSGGSTVVTYGYGPGGDIPIIGDWNGDGRDDVGVNRGANFFKRSPGGGSTVITYGYGGQARLP